MINSFFDQFNDELPKAEISMTPLIDMVFILLIFFVVTTTFTKETGINVNKAKATTATVINDELITVAIDDNGDYWYNKSVVSLDMVVNSLCEAVKNNDQANIVIIPDKNGRVEPLVTLMDRLRSRDISRFSLGTKLVKNY